MLGMNSVINNHPASSSGTAEQAQQGYAQARFGMTRRAGEKVAWLH